MEKFDMFEINVGGYVYTTSKDTLRTVHGNQGHYFHTLIEQCEGAHIPITRDKHGRPYIDRDPTHFKYIINYLRDGDLQQGLSEELLCAILKEAEFYSLQGLIDTVTSRLASKKIKKGFVEYHLKDSDKISVSYYLGCSEFNEVLKSIHEIDDTRLVSYLESMGWTVTDVALLDRTHPSARRMTFEKM
jgi:hypothetical protein